jgi:hypothetical protein
LLVLPVLYRTFHRKERSRSARSFARHDLEELHREELPTTVEHSWACLLSSHMPPFQIIE